MQLIAYNADRAAKAPNPAVYAELTKTLNNTLSQWAPNALKICTDADKLNIPDTVVFASKREAATEKYTKFISDVAEDENWVVSLVAQIPGIQVRRQKKKYCASAGVLTSCSRTLRSPMTSRTLLLIKVGDISALVLSQLILLSQPLHGTNSGLSIMPSITSPQSLKLVRNFVRHLILLRH